MNARRIGYALATIAVAMFVLAGNALAREKGDKNATPKKPKVTGTVGVTKETKDGKEEITAVTITQKKKDTTVVINVELDEKGKQLGTEKDGKKVIATGTITEKDGAKWMTVESYEEPKPKAPKQPK